MAGGPDLIVVGQVLVNDIVPAEPGPWRREIGGSALYAVAGARLWLDPARIGIVARIGRDCPFDVAALLAEAGVGHVAIRRMPDEQLIEWLIYEEDGSRRTLPRNRALRDVGGEGLLGPQPFFDLLLAMSPTAEDIPGSWLPAGAVHLCPQVGTRHPDSLAALRGRAGWISVDPSPYYSRSLDSDGLARLLPGCAAFMPSAQEVRPILAALGPEQAALALHRTGFPEIAIKNGAEPVIVAAGGRVEQVPVAPAQVVDPTGAGDSFCGAYAACRLLGNDPVEAARRASSSAALVVGSSGAREALALR
jgi:ribokinase